MILSEKRVALPAFSKNIQGWSRGRSMSKNFYVYVYYDPRYTDRAIYVGKGYDENRTYRRARHHVRFAQNPLLNNVLRKIERAGLKPLICILRRFKTEEEAFGAERWLIAYYGRRDQGTGSLCNLTDGGDGASGTVVSEETREKLSKAHMGNTYRRGIKNSEETRRKISLSHQGQKRDPSIGAAISRAKKGHTVVSQETRRKISEARKGKPLSAEHRRKISEGGLRRAPVSEETRARLSAALKGRRISNETRKRMSEAALKREAAKKMRHIGKGGSRW